MGTSNSEQTHDVRCILTNNAVVIDPIPPAQSTKVVGSIFADSNPRTMT